MTDREKLELAAKACGIATHWNDALGMMFLDAPKDTEWNPITNQSDSDRMACKLRIELEFDGDWIGAWHGAMQSVNIRHNNTDEDVCRAVREARLLVAVEIGRLMK